MRTFRLNKLVRDNILEDQQERGEKPTYRELSSHEHAEALVEKIVEEIREVPLRSTPEKIAEELADVQQALDDLTDLLGVTVHTISEAKSQKFKKMGGFKRGIFIENLVVPDGDAWGDYYASDPKRFPQIKD
jgi:predicted house-cleaning noncanonical NTP pyrophosphatase (MazG superfamily)